MHRPIAKFAFVTLLASGCSMEEGYTPISEGDKQDGVTKMLSLSPDSPSAGFPFHCEESIGCDIQLTFALMEDTIDETLADGTEVLEVTFTRPDGFSRVEPLIIGEATRFTDHRQWQLEWVGLEAGEYSLEVELVDLEIAEVYADAYMEPSIVDTWAFQGLDCSETARVCEGDSLCVGLNGGPLQCTAECFMDSQCLSGACGDFLCEPGDES